MVAIKQLNTRGGKRDPLDCKIQTFATCIREDALPIAGHIYGLYIHMVALLGGLMVPVHTSQITVIFPMEL